MDNIFSDTPLNGAIAWITLVYILFVAVIPWLGRPQNGPRGVLVRTAAALMVLGFLSAMVALQCNVGYCGHGAMVLPALLVLAVMAGVVTLLSAALAFHRWRK